MSDIDDNPDTTQMYLHLDEARQPYSAGMNASRNLERNVGGLTAEHKANLVEIAKKPHGPDCAFCQSFAGNPPALETEVIPDVRP